MGSGGFNQLKAACPACGRDIGMKKVGYRPNYQYYYFCEKCGYLSPKCLTTDEAKRKLGKNADEMERRLMHRLYSDDSVEAENRKLNRENVNLRAVEELREAQAELIILRRKLQKADEEIVKQKEMNGVLAAHINELTAQIQGMRERQHDEIHD